MKELVITEECEIEIPDIHLTIRYTGEKIEMILNGNTNIMCDGDLSIGSTGELSLISKKDIHIDAIGSNIHLNSGISKPMRDKECLE